MALASVVLIGILGVVADIGMSYANQRRDQNGVDAAALAAGRRIAAAAGVTDSCAALAIRYASGTDAPLRAYTEQMFGLNVTSDASLAAGTSGLSVSCQTVQGTSQVLVVRVAGGQRSPAFFGGILGVKGLPVAATAQSIVAPLASAAKLRPFAVCATTATQVRASPGTTFTLPMDNTDHGCGTSAGNWATLDFDGGSNSTTDLQSWIAAGFDPAFSASGHPLVYGDPGFNVNATQTYLDQMITARVFVLPVFDSVVYNGSNAQYRIVGFLTATPCRYKINNQTGPASGQVNPECGAAPSSAPNSYIQLRYSAYTPLGALNLRCTLADPTCDTGPHAVTLAD